MKRLMDVVLSSVGILFCIPIAAVISVMVKLEDGGPVLFTHPRVGLAGRIFVLLKFRTMTVDPSAQPSVSTDDDPRITKTGCWLRRTKLDELPQLVNVLKGDMSFVGPRPELPRYTALYTEKQRHVLDVKPGITDCASIKYRREGEILALSPNSEETYITRIMPDKITLNLDYARKANLWCDICVVLETLWLLLIPSPPRRVAITRYPTRPPWTSR